MSDQRFNTGNPIGSNSPLDRSDNTRNLDVAVNAPQDTFQDRLGKSRLTWAGVVKAGSGDPAIAVDAAARAEAAASQVQQNADQIAADAAQQAVQDVVAGVDGQVAVAQSAADRAETARDAAFVNADVYPDVATGLADVADGDQFQVVEGGEVVRYRRDSSSTQTEVARYPTALLVNSIASQTYGADRFTLNGYITPSGEFSASEVYRSTDFMPIEENVEYAVRTTNPATTQCAFYDISHTFISSFKGSGVDTPFSVTSPAGSAFIRLSTSLATVPSAGIISVGGRYNLEKLWAALKNFEIIIPATNVIYEGSNVGDEIDRISEALVDPMTGVIVVDTEEERNALGTHGAMNRAWPPGLRVYDEGLRSEVVADGIWWRLPDGTPADAAERTDVYPGWDEAIASLPTYATKQNVLTDVSSTSHWSVIGGTLSLDSSKGFPAIKAELGSGMPSITYMSPTALDLNSWLLFKLFVEDNSAASQHRLELLSSTGTVLFRSFLDANSMGANPRSFEASNDLRCFEVQPSQMVVVDPGATLAEVYGIRVYSVRNEGKTDVFWLSEVLSADFKPCITLRFDDALDSIYPNAYMKMREYGFPGITAVHTDWVGTSGYCTRDQLIEMQADGWDLVSHFTHQPEGGMNIQSYEFLDAGFRDSKKWLKEAGSSLTARSCYVAPQGQYNELNAKTAFKYYDAKIGGSHLNSSMPRRPEGRYNEGGSWARMGSFTGDNKSAAQMIAAAEEAITAQAWQMVMLHNIQPGISGAYATAMEEFHEFIEWLDANRDRIDVVSFSEMVKRMRGQS